MSGKLHTIIASTPNDIARVFALRAAVFTMEQICPYKEEFHGNDYCASHILGFVDAEPAAVLRVCYFAEFAKIERLAVMPHFRRTLIAKIVVQTGIELCRRKGYRTLYGHAQKRLVKFWSRFGFVPLQKNVPVDSMGESNMIENMLPLGSLQWRKWVDLDCRLSKRKSFGRDGVPAGLLAI